MYFLELIFLFFSSMCRNSKLTHLLQDSLGTFISNSKKLCLKFALLLLSSDLVGNDLSISYTF
jgi:hypothetical protein